MIFMPPIVRTKRLAPVVTREVLGRHRQCCVGWAKDRAAVSPRETRAGDFPCASRPNFARPPTLRSRARVFALFTIAVAIAGCSAEPPTKDQLLSRANE